MATSNPGICPFTHLKIKSLDLFMILSMMILYSLFQGRSGYFTDIIRASPGNIPIGSEKCNKIDARPINYWKFLESRNGQKLQCACIRTKQDSMTHLARPPKYRQYLIS